MTSDFEDDVTLSQPRGDAVTINIGDIRGAPVTPLHDRKETRERVASLRRRRRLGQGLFQVALGAGEIETLVDKGDLEAPT